MPTSSELGEYIASLETAAVLDTANDLLLIYDASQQALISETIDNAIPAGNGGSGFTEGAKITLTQTQAVSNGSIAEPAWNAEDWDTDTIHDSGTNPERATVNTTGKYLIVANIAWEYNNAGYRQASIVKNEAAILANSFVPPVTSTDIQTIQSVMTTANLTAGDYVTVWVKQTSGGSLNLAYADYGFCNLSIQRVG